MCRSVVFWLVAGHHQEEPQPEAAAPDLPEGGQASRPQLLPRQTTRRPRHPPPPHRHDKPRQPAPAHARSM